MSIKEQFYNCSFFYKMNKYSFLYLITCYALASIFTLQNSIDLSHQIIGSLFLIILFGIPHGAIDNIILQSESQISSRKFYFLYISCIFAYILFWILSPLLSFCFFLIISAYHFGESQLANYSISIKIKKSIYFFWGLALMSTLFFYNSQELKSLFATFKDTNGLNYIFNYNIIKLIFYLSNAIILLLLIFSCIKKNMDSYAFNSEIFQLVLIHITFYLFPVIISFTLYFVFLHSLKVLNQEYSYLNRNISKTNLFQFVKMLVPHTFFSLFFMAIFVYMSVSEIINMSILLFSIVSISVITLPHSIVMARFYNKFKKV